MLVSSNAVISTVGLSKVFLDFWRRARVMAVSNLDLQVEPGEIFGLLGPNGSGKSTTIKMILGLLHPTRGRVTIFGKPPDDVKTKSRIGYLPEESYSYRFLNARETLDYYATLFQIARRDRKRRIEELLEMVGLRSAARRPVGEYSKGMARRIGLAQALINDPDLLILDEPTSGLDPIGAKLVKDIIIRLGQVYRKTVLLSSHLLADVEEVCGRVSILYGGTVQVAGTMQEVLSRRDRTRIDCDRLSPETITEIERIVRQREGKEVSVATPLDRLEALFLRIVEQAQQERVATSGSVGAGEIATFLGSQEAGRRVLEELVRTEPVKPAAPEPRVPAVDERVLESLTAPRPARAAPEPGKEKPRREAEVDRSVLEGLTDGDEKDRAK